MNLERLPNEEKLGLCRKYYLGEIALLLTFVCLRIHLFFNIVIYHFCEIIFFQLQLQILTFFYYV